MLPLSILALTLAASGLVCQESPRTLPLGLGGVTLGMNREQVTEALRQEGGFGYTGEPDVTYLPPQEDALIEAPGGPLSFFGRSWFQFREGRLFTIIINLNPARADRHSVFTALRQKYGDPLTITPEKSEWRDGNVIMSLEKPLTLKYVDREAAEDLAETAAVEQTVLERAYREFLEEL